MDLIIESAVCLVVTPEIVNCSVPYYRMSSTTGLTSEAQLRYLLQWFGEFSELQREDFLPVLAAARGGKEDQLAATLAALSCADKPVSLFQCRIKLFNEWYPTWAEEEQDRLIKGVSDMDAEFGIKLQDLLTNGPQINGEINGSNESHPCDLEPVNEEWRNNEEPELESQEQVAQENVPVEIAAAS